MGHGSESGEQLAGLIAGDDLEFGGKIAGRNLSGDLRGQADRARNGARYKPGHDHDGKHNQTQEAEDCAALTIDQSERLTLILLDHESPTERRNVHPHGAHGMAPVIDALPISALAQQGALHDGAGAAAHGDGAHEGGARVEAQRVHDHGLIADPAADHHFASVAKACVIAEHFEHVVVVELKNHHANQRPLGDHWAGGESSGILQAGVEAEIGHLTLEQGSRAIEDIGQLRRGQVALREIRALGQTALQAEQDRTIGRDDQHVRVSIGAGNIGHDCAVSLFGCGVGGRCGAVFFHGGGQTLACANQAGGMRYGGDAADSLGSIGLDLGGFLFSSYQQRAVDGVLDRGF